MLGSQIYGEVGTGDESAVALYQVFHPMMEGFASLSFRPQLWVQNYPNFVHAPLVAEAVYLDESSRPGVLACESWGAQDGSTWNYSKRPNASRFRGGTVDGGVLFHPPEFEMDDYLGLNSSANVDSPGTTGYVTAAPGAGFALGKPHTDGGLVAESVTITQSDDPDEDGAIVIKGLNSSRVAVELIKAVLEQSSNELVVYLGHGGSQAVVIPHGTHDERPSTITPEQGMIRICNDEPGGFDTLEYWDSQGEEWRKCSSSASVA